ncbi:MAG: hypothetical protein R2701_11475 [Acidimicrobiales bacterium]
MAEQPDLGAIEYPPHRIERDERSRERRAVVAVLRVEHPIEGVVQLGSSRSPLHPAGSFHAPEPTQGV